MAKSKKTLTNTSHDPYQFTISFHDWLNLKAPIHTTMVSKEENSVEIVDHQPAITLGDDRPLLLESGISISPVSIAYQTFGTLNEQKSNAILVCHALTGDQYVSGNHPVTGRSGWWSHIVGSGLPLDTDHYFIIWIKKNPMRITLII